MALFIEAQPETLIATGKPRRRAKVQQRERDIGILIEGVD
jgi:hypothetical protein